MEKRDRITVCFRSFSIEATNNVNLLVNHSITIACSHSTIVSLCHKQEARYEMILH